MPFNQHAKFIKIVRTEESPIKQINGIESLKVGFNGVGQLRANNYSFVEVCRKSKVSVHGIYTVQQTFKFGFPKGGSKATVHPPPVSAPES